ncbi:uncharacterized protein LOC129002667 [Macrosteles quadrilineatus]|uniref:uncharacterized protein LOC129002667 n=1 Tax=Macrosteles quadrilineatus TaxID=74068 RepID=UPI0023E256C3|nr:uncharacterized protein LOC129002667 [Macrosteles quadrilineatus]XP_054286619.1 uncharacterized protein LOC129002667 [Macrosteles quadrilineatus]XP_054286620.1 uncharacterized protein LOC129002667 [Macrosteles quadrilineatus]XP_054286621.1 uncharacterized protein LOC129002667 [Macrosteles quadrilineatus]XP_054286622.1 uncharacterized protein LOC129002667 [Macrosteles quadrilineatus]
MMQPSKKLKRMENKKRKLAALLEITERNDKERAEVVQSLPNGPSGDYSLESLKSLNKAKTPQKQDFEHEEGEMMEDIVDHEDRKKTKSPHKKKKRKSKHNDVSETEEKRKHSKSCDQVDYEEWPSLDSAAKAKKKRKHLDSPTKDDQTMKSNGKRSSSFIDELESFKKDMERTKKMKEKKDKKVRTKNLVPAYNSEDENGDEKKEDEGSADKNEEDTNEVDELAELRKLLREKKKLLKEFPMVKLKGVGTEADLDRFAEGSPRTPVLPCDVQHFLMFSQLGEDCPIPRGSRNWIELKKFKSLTKTVVLVVEGLSTYDYFSSESSCPTLQTMDVKAEMVSPYLYNANIVEELCAVALTKKQKRELEKKFGKEICPEALQTDRVIKVLRSAFSITSAPKTVSELVEERVEVPEGDRFPRTDLLLSVWQLIEEGYPLPYGHDGLGNRYPDYVMTKDEYKEVHANSPMWALDCEMCLTKAGNELTRVSVVDENHKTVYESFCLPRNPIINYLTEFSGITPEMLKGVKIRLEDIQRDLRELFPSDVILVGQSLNGDMHALKMMHPYIIDTSVIFNLTGNRRYKSKLAKLTQEFLNEAIQQRGALGHDSVEDSIAALKLVQHKLTKSIEYGDAVLSGLPEYNATTKTTNTSLDSSHLEHGADEFDDIKVEVGPTLATSLFKHFTMSNRKATIISQDDILAEYATFVAAALKENKKLVTTVTADSNSDIIIRTGEESKKNDFTMAHMVLNEEDDIALVDTWLEMLTDNGSDNSLFITIFVGSHKNLCNGACFVKIKKPPVKHLPAKRRLAD